MMKTKTYLYSLILSVFGMVNTCLAQDGINLDGYWYLNEHTDLQITANYNAEELLSNYEVTSYYGLEFERAVFQLKGDKMQFHFMKSRSVDYYDEEEMDTVSTALFQLLYQNDTVFSIRPLDVGAVCFLDQIQQQGFTLAGEPERNETFYKQYWNEVSKAKGQKREAVINKWKTEHHLFVDEAVFHNEYWYQEDWDTYIDGPMIDSVYYSEMMISNEAMDSVHYLDYKIYKNGNFVMRQFYAPRIPNDGIPNVVYDKESYETIMFIPPVVMDEDAQPSIYEIDDSEKVEYIPPVGTDGAEPPVEEVYDGYKSDIVYYDSEEYPYVAGSTEDGYYRGNFDEQWMDLLNSHLIAYGPSKQIHIADSSSYSCNGFGSYCGKKRVRVFYKGTYKDFWANDFRSPILLYGFLFEFSEKEDFYTSFEPSENKNENFPISFQAK